MILDELLKAISIECHDESYSRTRAIELLNEAVRDIAATVRLPNLIIQDTLIINSGTRIYNLPDTYNHNLFEAYNFTGKIWCTILHSQKDVFDVFRRPDVRWYENQIPGVDSYSDIKGDITHVAVDGHQLSYLPIPERQNELEVKYYRVPGVLSDPLDDPADYIPAHLHRSLLVSWVMAHGFSKYTEVVQEDRTMLLHSNRYRADYDIGIMKLRDFYRYAPYSNPTIIKTRIWF